MVLGEVRVASKRNQARRSPSSIQTLEQARGRHVVVLVAGGVQAAHGGDALAVVLGELGQHVLRVDVVGVVVGDALLAGDLADRVQRGAADLAGALGHRVGHGEDLVGLLVEQQVEVAEVRPRHVPVEVLGLEIEREGVGEERGEAGGDVAHRLVAEVGAGAQARLAPWPARPWRRRSWRLRGSVFAMAVSSIWLCGGNLAHQSASASIAKTSAVSAPFSPMAMPAKVPASSLTWKARAVPMPWLAMPTAKPRAA